MAAGGGRLLHVNIRRQRVRVGMCMCECVRVCGARRWTRLWSGIRAGCAESSISEDRRSERLACSFDMRHADCGAWMR